MQVFGETRMKEEFTFQPHGVGRVMTFAELDQAVHAMLKRDIDAMEERIIRVAENQEVDIIDRRSRKEQDMIGQMKAADILLKFR
jgi:hypothetical protein